MSGCGLRRGIFRPKTRHDPDIDKIMSQIELMSSPQRPVIHEPGEGGRGEAAHVGAGELQGGGGHHHPGDRGHGGAVDSDQGRHRGI